MTREKNQTPSPIQPDPPDIPSPGSTFAHATLPDPARSDAAEVVFSEWRAPTSDLQRIAGDAVMAVGDGPRWPAGLLSHTGYLCADGRTVLHFSQWTGADAIDAWHRSDPPERVAGILEAVPGLERTDLTRFRPYRGRRYAERPVEGPPPLFIVPRFEANGHEEAASWIDAMLAAAAAAHEDQPIEGLLASHYFIGTEENRVLLLAEWTDLAANERFRRTRSLADEIIADHGVRRVGAKAYWLHGSRTAPAPARGGA